MSINVNVSGSPISIQRGKMVTVSPNHAKREFERRRLIRISQVRQQSKNIAEDIRNRVRQQKLKQVEDIEKEGQRKLKQWQARKLLELQNQYHDALRDLGKGHKEASKLENEEELLREKKENNLKTAEQRGRCATEKLRKGKEKQKTNLSVPIQKKIIVRDIENKRAKMIAHVKKSSESFKKKKDVDTLSTETEVSGIVTESDSDYEEVEIISFTTKKPSSLEKKNCEKSVTEEGNKSNTQNERSFDKPAESSVSQPAKYVPDYHEKDPSEITEKRTHTRISERIRTRNSVQSNRPDICDSLARPQTETSTDVNNCQHQQPPYPNVQQNVYACACKTTPPLPCRCARAPPRPKADAVVDIDQLKCVDFTDEEDHGKPTLKKRTVLRTLTDGYNQSSVRKAPPTTPKTAIGAPPPPSIPKRRNVVKEIPTRPKVTLRSVKSASVNSVVSFSKPPESNRAERIDKDSILTEEAAPEVDFFEKIRRQDREALLRGQKAAERQRLQREYEELMKKLPALQKLERLYDMNRDKPEYHMTEDRLMEKEKKKQNVLDNTFEKLFPDKRPPKVTIPLLKDRDEDDEDPVTLNLGVLDADEGRKKSRLLYTEKEVRDIIGQGKVPLETRIRKDQLKAMLVSLRRQKEELVREIRKLPDDSRSLSEAFGVSCDDYESTRKKSKERVATGNKNVAKSKPAKTSSKSVQTGKSLSLSSAGSPKIARKRKTEKEIVLISSSENLSKEAKKKTTVKDEKSQYYSNKRQKQQGIDVETAERRRSETPLVPVNSPVSIVTGDNGVKSKKAPTAVRQQKSSNFVSCACKKDKKQEESLKSKNSTGELCEIVIKIKDRKSSQIYVREKDNDKVQVGGNGNVASDTGSKIGNNDKVAVVEKKPSTSTSENGNVASVTRSKMNDKPKGQRGNSALKQKESSESRRRNEIKEALKDDCCKIMDGSDNKPKSKSSWHQQFSRNNSAYSNSSTSYMSPPQFNDKRQMALSPPTKLPAVNNNNVRNAPSNVLTGIDRLLAMSRLSVEELGVSSVSSVTTPSQSVIEMESNKASAIRFAPSRSEVSFGEERRLRVSTDATSLESMMDDESESKYAKIADQCNRRITSLTERIQRVRDEKDRILQNVTSLTNNNDSSTKYMDLPTGGDDDDDYNKDVVDDGSASASTSSSGAEAPNRDLLDIDLSLAARLKRMSPTELERLNRDKGTETDELDLAARLRALKEPPTKSKEGAPPNDDKDEETKSDASNDFVPFLLDIPKYPPFQAEVVVNSSKHKKPPPSRSYLAARKLTEDFAQPHELSTIPEQDSQLRLESATVRDKPETSKNELSIKTKEKSVNDDNVTRKSSKSDKRTEDVVATDRSENDRLRVAPSTNNPSDNDNNNTSGEEKIELYRMEAMLRSIGMDWAISTLRKTQETLALTSSSSSIECSNRASASVKELEEGELREFLARQAFQRISSSTLRSEASPGAALNEDDSRELSDIVNDNSFSKKQTSTPIDLSGEVRERDKSAQVFYSFADNTL